MTRLRVIVDPELCTGHGRCYSMGPQWFAADDQGMGLVTKQLVEDGPEIRTVVRSCPEGAIRADAVGADGARHS